MPKDMSGRRLLISGIGATVAAVAVGAGPASAQGPAADSARCGIRRTVGWISDPANTASSSMPRRPTARARPSCTANNLYTAHTGAYKGGSDADLGMVVCLRHFATPFAYTDVVWAKYGKTMSAMVGFVDPKTKEAPATNLYNSASYGLSTPNLGNTIDAVTKRGVYFAVCDGATHFLATQMAGPMGMTADAIYKDLAVNLIPNSRLVSAGVMAATRSQEYGYSLLYAG